MFTCGLSGKRDEVTVAACWKGNKEVYYLKIIIIRSKQKAWIEKEPAVLGEEG